MQQLTNNIVEGHFTFYCTKSYKSRKYPPTYTTSVSAQVQLRSTDSQCMHDMVVNDKSQWTEAYFVTSLFCGGHTIYSITFHPTINLKLLNCYGNMLKYLIVLI